MITDLGLAPGVAKHLLDKGGAMAKVAVGDIGVCECLYSSFKQRIISYLDSEAHNSDKIARDIEYTDKRKLDKETFGGSGITWGELMKLHQAQAKELDKLITQLQSIPDCKYGVKEL